ncbi:DUF456 domain-containing protein [Brevibacillus composti]|uniref:DUF456 domain-containing protein n=1 Tax=Brevibacillus composti TaxID=2796470 RepID=A0A7T5JPS7_9BACL|nr:DUF456 domain-containing protein [Brevibacillus composti]QQE75599.1 DUF456 domain-containing protein [Brevibacillus composti]QUO42625.1 DUF456 domain-containing protein [Brevibacillus composti]
MAYDDNERMNAERKEADNGLAEMVDQRDTEFAVDSWMGAVFTPQENNNTKQNIEYDPETQTERYLGEQNATPAGEQNVSPPGEQNATPAGGQFIIPAGGQTVSPSDDQIVSPAGGENVSATGGQESPADYPIQADVNAVPTRTTAERTNDYDVESAAEIAEPIRGTRQADQNQAQTQAQADPENGASGLGMTGLGLSILSLFLLPYLIAPVGIILGFMAFRRQARTLGVWAMIVGAAALIGALIVYPYFVAR